MYLAKTDISANFAKCKQSFWMYISFFFERSLSYSSITTEAHNCIFKDFLLLSDFDALKLYEIFTLFSPTF